MATIPTNGEFTKVPDGGAGGVFVVNNNDGTLDRPFSEIVQAFRNGKTVIIMEEKTDTMTVYDYVVGLMVDGDGGVIMSMWLQKVAIRLFVASTGDAYPTQS